MKRIAIIAGAGFALALAAAPLSIAAGKGGGAMGAHATPSPAATPMAPSQKSTTTSSPTPTTTTRGPAQTGQPNQDCETLGNQPGNSMSAPGSAFNPSGTAGGVYAGQQAQNSRNTASVSQYDVACARPSR